jgi:8-oxo-dGTP pyrophosphatase MutT (NUDIX family)
MVLAGLESDPKKGALTYMLTVRGGDGRRSKTMGRCDGSGVSWRADAVDASGFDSAGGARIVGRRIGPRSCEDPIVAARREVIEETGLRVRVQPQPITAYAALRQGEPMTVIVFSAIHESGEVMLSDEHDDYRWCNADELAELGAPVRLADAARAAWPVPA